MTTQVGVCVSELNTELYEERDVIFEFLPHEAELWYKL